LLHIIFFYDFVAYFVFVGGHISEPVSLLTSKRICVVFFMVFILSPKKLVSSVYIPSNCGLGHKAM